MIGETFAVLTADRAKFVDYAGVVRDPPLVRIVFTGILVDRVGHAAGMRAEGSPGSSPWLADDRRTPDIARYSVCCLNLLGYAERAPGLQSVSGFSPGPPTCGVS
ncbi:hypothetical protein EBN03_12600 [Nocardia stercoris]|uniref:Uncharacterized protein n=1 Tax=Nocardia stercoris TaxID=2483361 RepID=A0A3M2L713_9NOCA|nr:hypothetical protein EBN03_12600 [Nocardia stercoris]